MNIRKGLHTWNGERNYKMTNIRSRTAPKIVYIIVKSSELSIKQRQKCGFEIFKISSKLNQYLDIETKGHKQTKDSRDEIHETHSRL
jgi:hypothetical protein